MKGRFLGRRSSRTGLECRVGRDCEADLGFRSGLGRRIILVIVVVLVLLR
jgi:hypothetical protein